MSAFELVCRMVTPAKGRRGRRRPRAVAATTSVTPPPAVTPATVSPLTAPQPAAPDDETTFFPRTNSRPYARQETTR